MTQHKFYRKIKTDTCYNYNKNETHKIMPKLLTSDVQIKIDTPQSPDKASSSSPKGSPESIVKIETPHLILLSLNHPFAQKHVLSLQQLFLNPTVMQKIDEKFTLEIVTKHIDDCLEEWRNGDKFNAFCIFTQPQKTTDTPVFIGYISLNHTNNPNNLNLTLALLPEYWNRGFGTEASSAIVNHYVPLLLEQKYMQKGYDSDYEQKPFELLKIQAYVSKENEFAQKILETLGFASSDTTAPESKKPKIYSIKADSQEELAEKLREETEPTQKLTFM